MSVSELYGGLESRMKVSCVEAKLSSGILLDSNKPEGGLHAASASEMLKE